MCEDEVASESKSESAILEAWQSLNDGLGQSQTEWLSGLIIKLQCTLES